MRDGGPAVQGADHRVVAGTRFAPSLPVARRVPVPSGRVPPVDRRRHEPVFQLLEPGPPSIQARTGSDRTPPQTTCQVKELAEGREPKGSAGMDRDMGHLALRVGAATQDTE